jgi:hypothetical protein
VASRGNLIWSATPEDLLPTIIARQPVAFAARAGGLPSLWRRDVQVVLVPLEDLRDGYVLGDVHNDWLLWQSVTGRGLVTRLPTDVDVLANTMQVPRRGDGLVFRTALRRVFDLLYDERRL